jgi:cell division protein FtsB
MRINKLSSEQPPFSTTTILKEWLARLVVSINLSIESIRLATGVDDTNPLSLQKQIDNIASGEIGLEARVVVLESQVATLQTEVATLRAEVILLQSEVAELKLYKRIFMIRGY